MKIFHPFCILVLAIFSCVPKQNTAIEPSETYSYFPPTQSQEWQNVETSTLGWNEESLNDLYNYLEENNTRAFIILKDGKIAVEKYFGRNITNTSSFDESSQWYWASAGKTITATLVGIAQQEGLIDINKPTSDYLGEGWTSTPFAKEQLITVRDQLCMTTGLDYEAASLDCTSPSCLQFKADAGTQWYYHNGPYTLLKSLLEGVSQTDYNTFTYEKLGKHIGMNGQWVSLGANNVFWSTARDMARFGLLILNQGKWNENSILHDQEYFEAMVNTSQNHNRSYGYLWWLNGKESIMLPGFSTKFNQGLSPNAPSDLVAGMGKNGQFVEVVPSQNLVVIRMGEEPSNSLVPIQFHDEMWAKINLFIDDY